MSSRPTEKARPQSTAVRSAVVRMPQPARADKDLVDAVVQGETWAAAALLDRYGPLVERVIRRILGHDYELEDLVHDAFVNILSSIHQVRDGQAIKAWIVSVAIHTAHHAIRRRRLARKLFFWQREEPRIEPATGPREGVQRLYLALEQLSAKDRVAFALRHLEEMQLEDVAVACGVSLATIKRRLVHAEKRFVALAKRDPVLQTWMSEGDRWTDQ